MVRIIACLILGLTLGACAQTTTHNLLVSSNSGSARPEVIVVSEFSFSPDVVLLDRGFAAQLKRKMRNIPPEQVREHLAARVSHEIVATMVRTLREAGLEARQGREDVLTPEQVALVVKGKVRSVDQGNRTRRNIVGFGAGKSQVVADVVVMHHAQRAEKEALAFVVEAASGRRPGAIVMGPVGAAGGAAVAVASAGAGMASEKLSADVEAEARRVGQTAARRIITFATEQGWLAKPGA